MGECHDVGKEERVWRGVGKVTKVLNGSGLWSGKRSMENGRSVGECLTGDRSKGVWMTADRS